MDPTGTNVDLPETGTATCSCFGHKLVVNADTDPKMEASDRVVTVSFWSRGTHQPYSPRIKDRVVNAWKWLRGRPEPVDEVLLRQDEALAHLDAVVEAVRLTWPNLEREVAGG